LVGVIAKVACPNGCTATHAILAEWHYFCGLPFSSHKCSWSVWDSSPSLGPAIIHFDSANVNIRLLILFDVTGVFVTSGDSSMSLMISGTLCSYFVVAFFPSMWFVWQWDGHTTCCMDC
jgi:hypothetical protein